MQYLEEGMCSMQADILSVFLGFFEGFALIVSPCILPILPIILVGSLTGSKERPFGIIIGFIAIFALFTLFSRKLVLYSGINLNLVRYVSFGLLLLFGIILLSSHLTELFARLTKRLTGVGVGMGKINDPQAGFISGVLFGGIVALIWTPCAGPILAAVIVQTVVQKSNYLSFLILLAFGMGVGIPMFMIALFGRKIITKLSFFRDYAGFFRKTLGAVIILSVGYMIYLEGALSTAYAATSKSSRATSLQNGILLPYAAPAISGISAWINSEPLQINDLKGKVVLIDFWAYSCINCVRTLPYLNNWYEKYRHQGFVIIGIHSPEFDFESKFDNVKNAVAQDQIKYPVALDNQFKTWLNFGNSYWPAHYLIDKQGRVVYTHFGEGEYDLTENNIRYLLGVKEPINSKLNETQQYDESQTPETYLGFARADHFSGLEPVLKNQSAQYTYPKKLPQDYWALQGKWVIFRDKIISDQKGAKIKIHFHAKKVFIVMGISSPTGSHIELLLNDAPLLKKKGRDVVDSGMHVTKHTLFEAVSAPQSDDGILEIITDGPGLEIYTFTFGG